MGYIVAFRANSHYAYPQRAHMEQTNVHGASTVTNFRYLESGRDTATVGRIDIIARDKTIDSKAFGILPRGVHGVGRTAVYEADGSHVKIDFIGRHHTVDTINKVLDEVYECVPEFNHAVRLELSEQYVNVRTSNGFDTTTRGLMLNFFLPCESDNNTYYIDNRPKLLLIKADNDIVMTLTMPSDTSDATVEIHKEIREYMALKLHRFDIDGRDYICSPVDGDLIISVA